MRKDSPTVSLQSHQKGLTSPEEIAHGIDMLRRHIDRVKALNRVASQNGDTPPSAADTFRVPEEVFQFHARREIVMTERHIRESVEEIFGTASPEAARYRHFRINAGTRQGIDEAIAALECLIFQLEEKRLALVGACRPPSTHTGDIDPLTDLYSRTLLDRYIAQEVDRSQRYGYPCALIFFSLRNWRSLHIAHGAAISHAILVRMACACKASVRGYDFVARMAEDEFAVLLPQSDSNGARLVARRIVEKFEHAMTQLSEGLAVKVEFGMATFPFDGDTPAGLFYTAAVHRMSFTQDLTDIKIPG
ncbi:MAG TPA: GGDEF domain-containing protein [Nitrospiraceae bacterium]|nr:GGDEF domain-containing protein [Nitrospiraceae bacterium]